jgi:hypothetical protein
VPPPGVVAAERELTIAPPPEAPKKKRGFWSRVFGIGRDEALSQKQDENQ